MASTLLQALCLVALAAGAYSNPVPTPPPVKSGTATSEAAGGASCTTVLTSLVTGFQGDFTAKVAKTVYTKTVTEYERVDCGGCVLSITTELAKFWGGFGPQQVITATTTARHASTTTSTVCAVRPTPPPPPPPPTHGQIPARVADGHGPEVSSSGECTFTKVIVPTPHLLGEGNKTVYTTTATETSHVDCGGCNYIAVSTTSFMHPGPVVQYTATTTAATPAAETAYVCLKSPSVVLPPGTRPATTTATTTTTTTTDSSSPATVRVTITKTVYAGTVDVVRTVTCRPHTSSHGAIPGAGAGAGITSSELETHTRGRGPRTRTAYTTTVVSASATRTRTAFRCAGGKGPGGSGSTPVVTARGEDGRGLEGRAAGTTTPPKHPSLPASPTVSTITVNFPPRG